MFLKYFIFKDIKDDILKASLVSLNSVKRLKGRVLVVKIKFKKPLWILRHHDVIGKIYRLYCMLTYTVYYLVGIASSSKIFCGIGKIRKIKYSTYLPVHITTALPPFEKSGHN